MNHYKSLLDSLVECKISGIITDDDYIRSKINYYVYMLARVRYPASLGALKIDYNIDYSYCGIPHVDVMGCKAGNTQLGPQHELVRYLNDTLQSTYDGYVALFAYDGYSYIYRFYLIEKFKELLILFKENKSYNLFLEKEKEVRSTIWTILCATDGPDVLEKDIELPIVYGCHEFEIDEWPPLRIGTDKIIDRDVFFEYSNGDIVAQTMTNLFEKCKKEIYK